MTDPFGQPSSDRPRIAISIGDPLGIGPEIVVKALADADLRQQAVFHVYGTVEPLRHAARAAGLVAPWLEGGDAEVRLLEFRGPQPLSPPNTSPGATAAGGAESFEFVERAIAAAKLPADHPEHAGAIVTAPISKTSWHLAGGSAAAFPGHTELLAHRFNAARHAMLFVGPAIRVMLATIHIPLREVAQALTADDLAERIELAAESCVILGIDRPRIAVCGLNPHAGEGGLLGDEDDRIIAPAINRARTRGIDVGGPFPADTLFSAAAAAPFGKGRFDCVVAMYHDQGLIPCKLLDGMRTVNVTAGLPVIRTSPAHGTAFDIAGRNVADPTSMHCAIELAIRMANRRRTGWSRPI